MSLHPRLRAFQRASKVVCQLEPIGLHLALNESGVGWRRESVQKRTPFMTGRDHRASAEIAVIKGARLKYENQPQPGRKTPYDDARKPQLRSHKSICGSNRTR